MARHASRAARESTKGSRSYPAGPAKREGRRITLKAGTVYAVYAVGAFAIMGLVIANLGQRAAIAADALVLHKLNNRLDAAEAKRDRLRVKRVRLRSIDRIERIASDKLEMRTPVRLKYIILPPELATTGDSKDSLQLGQPSDWPSGSASLVR